MRLVASERIRGAAGQRDDARHRDRHRRVPEMVEQAPREGWPDDAIRVHERDERRLGGAQAGVAGGCGSATLFEAHDGSARTARRDVNGRGVS